MTQRRSLLIAAAVVVIASVMCSCASVSTIQPPQSKALTDYKRAYIEQLPSDEFLIYPALFYELSDIGMEVVSQPFDVPSDTDLVVKYSYDSGWDMTKYLQAFQFQFIDAYNGKIMASTSFRSRGVWLGVRDERLERAFNDLRAKNGLPPTTQFD